jgi:hypothetical protein
MSGSPDNFVEFPPKRLLPFLQSPLPLPRLSSNGDSKAKAKTRKCASLHPLPPHRAPTGLPQSLRCTTHQKTNKSSPTSSRYCDSTTLPPKEISSTGRAPSLSHLHPGRLHHSSLRASHIARLAHRPQHPLKKGIGNDLLDHWNNCPRSPRPQPRLSTTPSSLTHTTPRSLSDDLVLLSTEAPFLSAGTSTRSHQRPSSTRRSTFITARTITTLNG